MTYIYQSRGSLPRLSRGAMRPPLSGPIDLMREPGRGRANKQADSSIEAGRRLLLTASFPNRFPRSQDLTRMCALCTTPCPSPLIPKSVDGLVSVDVSTLTIVLHNAPPLRLGASAIKERGGGTFLLSSSACPSMMIVVIAL
jgi:hypothetical protein